MADHTLQPSHDARPSRREWMVLAAILAIGALLRCSFPSLSALTDHTARDLYRTLLLMAGRDFPLLGSEAHYGGRVLGPGMYVLCTIPMAISTDPRALVLFIGAWNVVYLFCAWLFARRLAGPVEAMWAVALLAVFPLDIAGVRYNWNPGFLPGLVLLVWWSAWECAARGRWWWLVGVAGGIGLGLHFHLSIAVLAAPVALLLALGLRNSRPPLAAVAAAVALLLVLLGPALYHEATTGGANIEEMVQAPLSQKEADERIAFNPNGIRSLLPHLATQVLERQDRIGFTYLEILARRGEANFGTPAFVLVGALDALAKAQLLFWLAGMGVGCLALWRWWSSGRPRDGSFEKALLGVALVAAHAAPVVVLSFFNYHGAKGETSVAALRYYLIAYPFPFIAAGMGIAATSRWSWPGGRVHWPRVATVLGGIVLASNIMLCAFYLSIVARTGRFAHYINNYDLPSIATLLWVREVLLGEVGMDRDSYLEDVHPANFAEWYLGETTLDYVVLQDPRSLTNSEDSHLADRRWLIHAPWTFPPWERRSPFPVLPEGARETRRWTQRATNPVTIIEYVPAPGALKPETVFMRNYYYWVDPMRYLGSDDRLREKAWEEMPAGPPPAEPFIKSYRPLPSN